MTDNLRHITADIPAALLTLLVNHRQAGNTSLLRGLENKYTIPKDYTLCEIDYRFFTVWLLSRERRDFERFSSRPHLKFRQGHVTRLQRFGLPPSAAHATYYWCQVMISSVYQAVRRSHYEISQTVNSVSGTEERLLNSCVGLQWIQISGNNKRLRNNMCILIHLLKRNGWRQ